jgi:predicted glycosyltransferase
VDPGALQLPGYITGFDPAAFADRDALRAELGYHPDERVCIVTVGGSGVGADLLGRVIASFAEAKRAVPQLRMIVVTGPGLTRGPCPRQAALRFAPTSTSSTSTSPRATSRSCRAG